MAAFEQNFDKLYFAIASLNQTQTQHAVLVNKRLDQNTEYIGKMKRDIIENKKLSGQANSAIADLDTMSEERSLNVDTAVQSMDINIQNLAENIKLYKLKITDIEKEQTDFILTVQDVQDRFQKMSSLEDTARDIQEKLWKQIAMDGVKIKTIEQALMQLAEQPKSTPQGDGAEINIANRKAVVIKARKSTQPSAKEEESELLNNRAERHADEANESQLSPEGTVVTENTEATDPVTEAVADVEPVAIVKHVYGRVEIERKQPLRIWDGHHHLVFLHIGKAGGTSFDGMMNSVLKKMLKKPLYAGSKHFDWSYIDEKYPTDDVLTIFRDPSSRAVSHFHFMQSLGWTKGMKIRDQTISEFLQDPASMMANRGAWQDGQAAVSWLTGTHVGTSWVGKGKQAQIDKNEMEVESLQLDHILNLAADRMENMFWFAILEDMDRSLELLQHQLNITEKVKINLLIFRYLMSTLVDASTIQCWQCQSPRANRSGSKREATVPNPTRYLAIQFRKISIRSSVEFIQKR